MSSYISLLTKANLFPKRCIFEIGGHDGTDSALLNDTYHVPVYAFEPNPTAISRWRLNAGGRDAVHLVEQAVCETDGTVSFFAVDPEKYENIGASALSLLDFSKRSKKDPDFGRETIQTEIKVPSTRLDTFIRASGVSPDTLCLDCQESELKVLRSMGEALGLVDIVVSECTTTPTYAGGCTFDEIENYLQQYGLRFVASSLRDGGRPRPPCFWSRKPKFGFFDAVFAKL